MRPGTFTMKEILHTADGIGDKPMEMHEQCAHAEVVELLELVQQEWTFHDLDEYDLLRLGIT